MYDIALWSKCKWCYSRFPKTWHCVSSSNWPFNA